MRCRPLTFLSAVSFAVLAACGTPAPPEGELTTSASVPAPSFDAGFWAHWGDGSAEIAAYDLIKPRYGHLRKGVAVTIFVTETFSNSLRVKADPGKHPAGDEYPVMKLNLVEDYQTGIYDYNDMTSSFMALAAANGRPAGTPTKVSFSTQEWCGHVYHQLLFDATAIRSARHSYFDGEADEVRDLPHPPGGVTEDALFHWARGMAAPLLKPGERRSAPFLASLQAVRHSHGRMEWSTVTLSRSAEPQTVKAPAGEVEVELFSAAVENGPQRTFYVERNMPHRIVRWESSTGEHAELLASERLKYWQMNGPGNEEALKKLGLSLRPPRTP